MKPEEIKAKRVSSDSKGVRILIGGRASYAYLLNSVSDDVDDPNGAKRSYRTAILFPTNAPAQTLTIVREAITDCVKLGVNSKWGGKRPVQLQLPLNKGNDKFNDDPEKYAPYENMFYLSAKKAESMGRPILKAYGKAVTEPGVIESGDWCVFDITFYPFNNRAKGVAVGLNGVTLIREGERFGGGPSETSIDEQANDLYGDVLGTPDPFADSSEDDDPLAGLM